MRIPLKAAGNDWTGLELSDPCGCTATCQDPMGLRWEVRLCYECRKREDAILRRTEAENTKRAARRRARRAIKAARKRNRKRGRR